MRKFGISSSPSSLAAIPFALSLSVSPTARTICLRLTAMRPDEACSRRCDGSGARLESTPASPFPPDAAPQRTTEPRCAAVRRASIFRPRVATRQQGRVNPPCFRPARESSARRPPKARFARRCPAAIGLDALPDRRPYDSAGGPTAPLAVAARARRSPITGCPGLAQTGSMCRLRLRPARCPGTPASSGRNPGQAGRIPERSGERGRRSRCPAPREPADARRACRVETGSRQSRGSVPRFAIWRWVAREPPLCRPRSLLYR